MAKQRRQSRLNPDAVFIGWQESSVGDPFPLYNVTASNHPSYGSTVSETTLREMHLQIPLTPQARKGDEHSSDPL